RFVLLIDSNCNRIYVVGRNQSVEESQVSFQLLRITVCSLLGKLYFSLKKQKTFITCPTNNKRRPTR
ncbi:MAG: hypothetical protein LBJ00_05885, partial [Planctomycetaceae bacterium]|nr:hypothetical protein [Planctomycetaceae bacterium]